MDTEPSVLIGFFGDRVPDDDETSPEALNKFGGKPVWIDGKVPQEYPFMCSICGAELAFVCQVATPYCGRKRCLYLFGCHKSTDCNKYAAGWKAVRGVVEEESLPPAYRKTQEAEEPESAELSKRGQIPEDSTDWLQAAFGSATADDCCTVTEQTTQKLRTRAPPPRSLPKSKCVDSFGCGSELMQPFFIEVEDEPPDSSDMDATGRRARELQQQYEERESDDSSADRDCNKSDSVEAETYEESSDKIFLKLQKRILRSPRQVIRYSLGGKPLLISPLPHEEANKAAFCPHCRGDRVFEMQLVPAAADEIYQRRHSSTGQAPIEWGVVAVFTCKNDCTLPSNYAFEHLVVQEIL